MFVFLGTNITNNLGVSFLPISAYNISTPINERTPSRCECDNITMEHILISPGKLKLMLTKSDLDKYNLDTASLEGAHTHTRRAFRALLSDVKRVAGFDASSDKVFIQLYPSRDGGAEIYITRLVSTDERIDKNSQHATGVYRFSSLGDLLSACAHSYTTPKPSKSSAWQCDDGAYYLITSDKFNTPLERFEESMRTYGHAVNANEAKAYVFEHSNCLIDENAICTLARLA